MLKRISLSPIKILILVPISRSMLLTWREGLHLCSSLVGAVGAASTALFVRKCETEKSGRDCDKRSDTHQRECEGGHLSPLRRVERDTLAQEGVSPARFIASPTMTGERYGRAHLGLRSLSGTCWPERC